MISCGNILREILFGDDLHLGTLGFSERHSEFWSGARDNPRVIWWEPFGLSQTRQPYL